MPRGRARSAYRDYRHRLPLLTRRGLWPRASCMIPPMFIVGVDVGGTFTDLTAIDDAPGRVVVTSRILARISNRLYPPGLSRVQFLTGQNNRTCGMLIGRPTTGRLRTTPHASPDLAKSCPGPPTGVWRPGRKRDGGRGASHPPGWGRTL